MLVDMWKGLMFSWMLKHSSCLICVRVYFSLSPSKANVVLCFRCCMPLILFSDTSLYSCLLFFN
jgi:hypothetical protein